MSTSVFRRLAPFAAVLALAATPAAAEPGNVYTFLGPTGAGKTTTIAVLTSMVLINDGTGDLVVADRRSRKLYVTGPDGSLMDAASMMPRGAVAASAPAVPSGGDPVEDIDAYLAGFPDAMKDQIKAQIALLPRNQQIQLLNTLRGQMGLAAIQPGALAAQQPARKASPAGPTGNTGMLGTYPVREIAASGDMIWVTDVGNVREGAAFVEGMTDFSSIMRELTAGLPIQNSSMFQVGELGGFPIRIMTADGDVIDFAGVETRDITVALPAN